ncbi:MAG TPA: hypothetical protein VJ853_13955, partial [Thermoanaerobaculia bacterium]|nr:hypothetical protein [Thermoanaerobaculia bacterium]
ADVPPFVPAPARVISAHSTFNESRIDVQSAGNALLVCSITRHRYWSATIDDNPAPLLPVNIQYQALMIPAGRHAVHLEYRNGVQVASGIVSLVATAIVVALAVRRQKGHEPGGSVRSSSRR